VSGGDHCWFKRSTGKKRPVTETSKSYNDDDDNKNNNNKLAEAAELIDDKSPYYKYTPANVLENENFKLSWNRSILTDKTTPFNRPDITFMIKKTKNTFSIHTAVTNTHNLAKTTTVKQNKYQELAQPKFSSEKFDDDNNNNK